MDAQTNLNIDPRELQTDDCSLDVFTPSSFYLMKGPDYFFFSIFILRRKISSSKTSVIWDSKVKGTYHQSEKKTFSTNILETKHGQFVDTNCKCAKWRHIGGRGLICLRHDITMHDGTLELCHTFSYVKGIWRLIVPVWHNTLTIIPNNQYW